MTRQAMKGPKHINQPFRIPYSHARGQAPKISTKQWRSLGIPGKTVSIVVNHQRTTRFYLLVKLVIVFSGFGVC